MDEVVALPVPDGPPLRDLAAALPSDRWPVFLDSGDHPSALGVWNFLAFDPVGTLEVNVGDSCVADPSARALGRLDRALDDCWPDRGRGGSAGEQEGLPPFRGGALAVLGYDLGRELERLPARVPRDGSLPDLLAGIYPFVLAEEVATGRRLVVGRGSSERARAWRAEVGVLARNARGSKPLVSCAGAATSTFTRSRYLAAVEAAREHILEGDIYQVNLSQRFELPFTQDVADLQAALRARSPAPFGAVIRTPGGSVVSSSPELFLRRRGRRLESRPIKGTRPRGVTPEEDARMAAELVASDKENAELAMIVDLVRNDLGRSAEVGSVEVDLPFGTDAWATVFHRVATVHAQLPIEARTAAVVEAAFPPASVTGTPKISAQTIIEELEPVRRHAYTGAIGWFDADGDCDLSVAIRIATAVDGRLFVPVGGGITLASEPVAEYEETLHKARGLFDVLGLPLPWEGSA